MTTRQVAAWGVIFSGIGLALCLMLAQAVQP